MMMPSSTEVIAVPKESVEFLAAWKDAVRVSGKILYNVRSPSVAAAASKNDLRPDFDAIEQHLQTTPGDHMFLIAVLQFFSHSSIERICEDNDIEVPRLPHLSSLRADEQDIVFRLITTYEGW